MCPPRPPGAPAQVTSCSICAGSGGLQRVREGVRQRAVKAMIALGAGFGGNSPPVRLPGVPSGRRVVEAGRKGTP